MSLKCFFEPGNIAVIGASNDPGKAGCQIFKNLLELGFAGKVFPVNPKLPELFGKPCYKSLKEIGEKVEMIIVSIPAFGVPDIFEEAAARGDVKAAVIIASGFAETKDPVRTALQERIRDISGKAGIRVMGPNCVGVMNTSMHLDTTFAAGVRQIRGGMSVISQSGGLGASLMVFATNQPAPMGFAKWAHVGNQMDVDVLEVMRYYKDDPDTKVIAMYMEGLSNAGAFLEVAREVSAKKPIILIKVGRTEAGSGAAASHTGSLVGSDNVYDAAFKQAGILRVDTLEELLDTAKMISMQPKPKGGNIMVLTEAGGPGIIAMDELGRNPRLKNPPLAGETVEALRAILPPMAIVDHTPGYVDMSAAANEPQHGDSLKASMADPGVDGVVHISVPPTFLNPTEMARETVKSLKGATKPVAICYMAGDWLTEGRILLEDAGIPTFDMPDRAAKAMSNLCRREEILKNLAVADLDARAASPLSAESEKLLASRAAEGKNLTEPEARRILGEAGIPLDADPVAANADEAVDAFKKFNQPVVMKVVSPQILHKSDAGGVRVNLKTESEVREAFSAITASAKAYDSNAAIEGVLVSPMAPAGTEMILGATRDAQFGPVLMAGFGGIYVEVLKDVAIRIAPFGEAEALRMLEELKLYPLLKGVRGQAPLDASALAKMLVRLSNLMLAEPLIKAVDLNPVRLYAKGALPLDARIIV